MEQLLQYFLNCLIAAAVVYTLNKYFSGGQYRGARPQLRGFTAVVTGGNSGIGRETVLSLVEQGCRVVVGARDRQKSEELVKMATQKYGDGLVQEYYLDLGDVGSVREFAGKIKWEKVDFLVNNAGVMAIPQRTLTKSGHEMHYGVNHLGHFYLTSLLWDKLNKSQFFRVVNVSSLAHGKYFGVIDLAPPNLDDINLEKRKYNPLLAYSYSKLYNNLFTHALAAKIPAGKGMAFSLHPGVVRTQLTRHMGALVAVGLKLVEPLYAIFSKSAKEGAQTTLKLLYDSPQNIRNGGYYADCRIARQNKFVEQENWEKLWLVSEKDLQIKFGQN